MGLGGGEIRAREVGCCNEGGDGLRMRSAGRSMKEGPGRPYQHIR